MKLWEIEDLRAKSRALNLELEKLENSEHTDGREERITNLKTAQTKLTEQIAEADADREQRLQAVLAAYEAGRSEPGFEPAPTRNREPKDEVRDLALKTIDRFEDILAPKAGDRLVKLVRADSPRGETSRYITAVGSAHYNSAFGRLMADPTFGHLKLSREEMQAVREVEEARTAILTSSTGFPLPFQLDPSIALSGSGALCPVRQLARVITVSAPTWKGVTADSVVSSYDNEAQEVSDDSPALVQPSITAVSGRAFVQASMESFDDWPGLQGEMLQLISDGRDVLDSSMFLGGTGIPQPVGILNIGATGALGTAQRIQSAGSAVYAVADIYSLIESLPPRFAPRATFAMSQTYADKTYRLVAAGSTSEPALMPTRNGGVLGRPLAEWSSMGTATTSGTKVAILGDWQAGVTIIDRLGMVAELVPNLLGSSAHLPLGVRGIFVRWRSGIGVVVPNALRYLELK